MSGLFREETLYTAGVILLLSFSILCQLLIGVSYGRLIRETENMATTENRLLKQCKCKFINCFQLHEGVPNIPVFADKFLNRIQFGKLTMAGIKQLSGQLVLLAVFLCGLGACRSIIEGKTLGQLLPWYVLGIGGVYLYFAVSGLVDMQGKQKILKTNLVDYLENHLLESLSVLEENKKRIEPPDDGQNRKRQAAEPPADGRRKRLAAGLPADREDPDVFADSRGIRQGANSKNGEYAVAEGQTGEAERSNGQAFSSDRQAQAAELEEILQELFV